MAGAATTQESFFVTLPSNSSLNEFPDNTLTKFKVRLPYSIHLAGEYECALVDTAIPTSWYNLITTQDHPTKSSVIYRKGDKVFEKKLKEGYYPNIKSLVNEVRAGEAREVDDDCEIFIMERAEKVQFNLQEDCEIILNGRITRMLGFDTDYKVIRGQVIPPQTYNINSINNLFIYTDILEHEIVGDTRAPLLRVVNVENRNGDQLSLHYDTPHYKRVQTKVFDTIEIDIRDGTGELIPFTRGTLILTLHFKRKAPSYL